MQFFDRINESLERHTVWIRRWYKYRKLRASVRREQYELYRSMPMYPKCDTAFEIVKEQGRKGDSKIEFAPKSGEFYITNANEQYIIMTSQYVRVINGIYHYDVTMSYESTQYLDKYLKRIIERRRAAKKRFIESKISNSLDHILDRAKSKVPSKSDKK
jgi:hypothetical protein